MDAGPSVLFFRWTPRGPIKFLSFLVSSSSSSPTRVSSCCFFFVQQQQLEAIGLVKSRRRRGKRQWHCYSHGVFAFFSFLFFHRCRGEGILLLRSLVSFCFCCCIQKGHAAPIDVDVDVAAMRHTHTHTYIKPYQTAAVSRVVHPITLFSLPSFF